MSSSVDSETASVDGDVEDERKRLGVRFAESTVGEPIIAALLFITGSFWLLVATVGVILSLIAMGIGEGVMAGVIGVFGFSGIFVGLLGYAVLQVYVRYQDLAY